MAGKKYQEKKNLSYREIHDRTVALTRDMNLLRQLRLNKVDSEANPKLEISDTMAVLDLPVLTNTEKAEIKDTLGNHQIQLNGQAETDEEQQDAIDTLETDVAELQEDVLAITQGSWEHTVFNVNFPGDYSVAGIVKVRSAGVSGTTANFEFYDEQDGGPVCVVAFISDTGSTLLSFSNTGTPPQSGSFSISGRNNEQIRVVGGGSGLSNPITLGTLLVQNGELIEEFDQPVRNLS